MLTIEQTVNYRN